MVAVFDQLGTPVAATILALVLILYVFGRNDTSTAYKVFAQTPLQAQCISVGISPAALPFTLVWSLTVAILLIPITVHLANLLFVAFSPVSIAGAVLGLMLQIVLVLTLKHCVPIAKVGLLSIQVGTRLTPSVKVVRSLVVQMEVFRSGRVFVTALRAAFEKGFQHSTSQMLSHTLAKKRTGDCELSLFRSYPSPLYLNYITVAACV